MYSLKSLLLLSASSNACKTSVCNKFVYYVLLHFKVPFI